MGWKYEVEGERARVVRLAEKQIAECHTDACVANGSAYGAGFGLVREGGEMKLYFVRHAAAIVKGGQVVDENRYLTLRGRKSFRLTANNMAKKGIVPDAIITSPLVRAVQTAEILSEALAFEGKLVVSSELAPSFDPAKLRLDKPADVFAQLEPQLVS